jgi:hypothetical protein
MNFNSTAMQLTIRGTLPEIFCATCKRIVHCLANVMFMHQYFSCKGRTCTDNIQKLLPIIK